MSGLYQILSSFILVVILQSQFCSAGNCSQCNFYNHKHVSTAKVKLEPLCGRRFSVEEPLGRSYFKYVVGICAELIGEFENAGAVQRDISQGGKGVVLGSLTQADVMSGSNWVMLEYKGGGNYSQSCGKSERKVMIMIVCNQDAPRPPVMKFVEENNEKTEDCYYLFQLEDASVCAAPDAPISYLSSGSIICIVFFSFVAIYLVGGFVIQRFFRGARGADQIPNVEFWKELGSLIADGCDLVCRCGRERDSYLDDRGHRGRSEGLLENASDHVDIDDGLLGM